MVVITVTGRSRGGGLVCVALGVNATLLTAGLDPCREVDITEFHSRAATVTGLVEGLHRNPGHLGQILELSRADLYH